jgi:hypothetical protein
MALGQLYIRETGEEEEEDMETFGLIRKDNLTNEDF